MKKFSKILFSALTVSSLLLNYSPTFAAADESSASQSTQNRPSQDNIMLDGENIKFEYVSTVYNGKEQKPAITIMSGTSALAENKDFTVEYPEDCVNAGKKTVTITGIGSYTGSFSATYLIEPLDCSKSNSSVAVNIAKCFYSGMPLMPEVAVTANGLTLDSGDYILAFSDNVNVTDPDEKAKCNITFRGNFSGSRTVEFDIEKTPSKDFEIQLMVSPGEHVVFDLTPIKPEGAVFGTIKHYVWNFTAEGQPKIAFNELSFTVPDNAQSSTAIIIPVTGATNREDFNIVVYPAVTDKIIPTLIANPVNREYNGEQLSGDIFAENGSYASADGNIIKGTWEFWDEPPLLPCDSVPYVVTFKPTDERYSSVETIVFVTVSRIEAKGLRLKANRRELAMGVPGQLVLSGIPEDYKGAVTLTCSNDEPEFSEYIYNDASQREYEVRFPARSYIYTFTAELSGDGVYMPASAQCTITVGNYVPPEEKPADKTTTVSELTSMILSANEGSVIKAEGIRSIPSDLVKAASEKNLTLEVKLNDTYTWIADTSKLLNANTLDLDISAAVIPAVLLDKIGGDNLCSFNIYAGNLGKGTKLRVSSGEKIKTPLFANLFLYSTTGELKFVSCSPMKSDGTAEISIELAGKYAVMTDVETKLKGDLNNSCEIDFFDVMGMIDEFLKLNGSTVVTENYSKFDMDNDGSFGFTDVMKLIDIFLNL